MKIRDVNIDDYDEILKLNQKDVVMLSEIDYNKLSWMHRISELFKVVEIDNNIAAFIIVFDSCSEYDSDNYKWFLDHHENFLYIDRIVVDENKRKLGLGRILYDNVFNYAKKNNFSLVCAEIDVKPKYNEASMKFHEKLGFMEVGEKLFQKTITVSLQIKEI